MGIARACVGCHDEDDIPEIDLTAFVVGNDGIVHDLKKKVVDVLMGLFDLVEQKDAIWILADRVCEDASVVIAYIAGR